MLYRNCSTAVAKVLLTGFAHQVTGYEEIDDMLLLLKSGNMFAGFGQANDPELHARHIEKGFADFERKAGLASKARGLGAIFMKGLLFADAGRRAFIWYPGNVLHLARYIQRHTR